MPPNLAGFVVDRFTADGVSILGFAVLIVLAFYPSIFKYALSGALAFTLVLTGFQAQNQYQFFRAPDSPADLAGKYAAQNFNETERDSMGIVAASTFGARVASLWMDSNNDLNSEGQLTLDSRFKYVLVIGNQEVSGNWQIFVSKDAFGVFERTD